MCFPSTCKVVILRCSSYNSPVHTQKRKTNTLSTKLGFQDVFPCSKSDRLPTGGDFRDFLVAFYVKLSPTIHLHYKWRTPLHFSPSNSASCFIRDLTKRSPVHASTPKRTRWSKVKENNAVVLPSQMAAGSPKATYFYPSTAIKIPQTFVIN